MRRFRSMLFIAAGLAVSGCGAVADPATTGGDRERHATGPNDGAGDGPGDPSAEDTCEVARRVRAGNTVWRWNAAIGNYDSAFHSRPSELGDNDWGTNGAVSVVAVPGDGDTRPAFWPVTVRVVNRTGTDVLFFDKDEDLFLTPEALNEGAVGRGLESARR